jgi:hypothetical protein
MGMFVYSFFAGYPGGKNWVRRPKTRRDTIGLGSIGLFRIDFVKSKEKKKKYLQVFFESDWQKLTKI